MWGLLLILACGPQKPAVPPPGKSDLRVVVLGSGTPVPDPDRSGPAIALTLGSQALLFDAGPGVVRRAAAAWERGETALSPDHLDRVFLTHLHSDHTTGLPDLWLGPWVVGRDRPLHVHGPPGTAELVAHLRAAWSADLAVRSTGPERRSLAGAALIAHEIDRPGPVFTADDLRVEAFPVRHGTWDHAFGYRIVAGDRVVVISGDTAPDPRVAEACDGCDLLLHEVYSSLGYAAIRQPGRAPYHPVFHTGAEELAAIARQARPGKLVLVHQLFMGAPESMLVREVADRWEGAVVSARDLDVFVLP